MPAIRRRCRGWAIPTATDIAFAVGVLALLGDRVPASLKVFLLALAILDDLGAIVIIAAVLHRATCLGCRWCWRRPAWPCWWPLNWRGVTRLAPYLLTGVFIWVCVLKSGVHATLAGVVVALAIPLCEPRARRAVAAASSWSTTCTPGSPSASCRCSPSPTPACRWRACRSAKLLEPVPLGIALGLVVGKPLGIFGATWLAVASGLAAEAGGRQLGAAAGRLACSAASASP